MGLCNGAGEVGSNPHPCPLTEPSWQPRPPKPHKQISDAQKYSSRLCFILLTLCPQEFQIHQPVTAEEHKGEVDDVIDDDDDPDTGDEDLTVASAILPQPLVGEPDGTAVSHPGFVVPAQVMSRNGGPPGAIHNTINNAINDILATHEPSPMQSLEHSDSQVSALPPLPPLYWGSLSTVAGGWAPRQ